MLTGRTLPPALVRWRSGGGRIAAHGAGSGHQRRGGDDRDEGGAASETLGQSGSDRVAEDDHAAEDGGAVGGNRGCGDHRDRLAKLHSLGEGEERTEAGDISAATLAPSTLSLISNMFPDPKERTFAIGVWISSFSAGGAIGPLIGGVLLTWFWWGSVFLIAVPVMILLLAVGPFLLPEYRDEKAGRIDLASAGLSLVAVLATIYGIKHIAVAGADGRPWLRSWRAFLLPRPSSCASRSWMSRSSIWRCFPRVPSPPRSSSTF